MNEGITHAYGHRLADVHLAGFAPAFTLSFYDSECSRNPPVPIASVVISKVKKAISNNRVTIKSKYEASGFEVDSESKRQERNSFIGEPILLSSNDFL